MEETEPGYSLGMVWPYLFPCVPPVLRGGLARDGSAPPPAAAGAGLPCCGFLAALGWALCWEPGQGLEGKSCSESSWVTALN